MWRVHCLIIFCFGSQMLRKSVAMEPSLQTTLFAMYLVSRYTQPYGHPTSAGEFRTIGITVIMPPWRGMKCKLFYLFTRDEDLKSSQAMFRKLARIWGYLRKAKNQLITKNISVIRLFTLSICSSDNNSSHFLPIFYGMSRGRKIIRSGQTTLIVRCLFSYICRGLPLL